MGDVNAGTVLRPTVVALPVALRGVVARKEQPQEVGQTDDFGVVDHQRGFGVAGLAAADFSVRRFARTVVARDVPDGRGVHARQAPESLFRAPETP